MLYRIFYSAIVIQWSIPWVTVIIASVGTLLVTVSASYFPLKAIDKTIIVEGMYN
jgi:ABC-type antimicrobial peptide transport system permease subunit